MLLSPLLFHALLLCILVVLIGFIEIKVSPYLLVCR
jgi:hypothetical protein